MSFWREARNGLKSSSNGIDAVIDFAASHNSTLSTKLLTILSINKYEIAKTQKQTAQVAKTPKEITKTQKKQIHTAKEQHTWQKYNMHETKTDKQ